MVILDMRGGQTQKLERLEMSLGKADILHVLIWI